MTKDHGKRVPESSRCSTATPDITYKGTDADGSSLREAARRDKSDRKLVFADRPDYGWRDAKAEYGFTPQPAIVWKHSVVRDEFRDEFQERSSQTEETGKPCERADGDHLLRSEHNRINHHERMPHRTREKAPKLHGFSQYERRPAERNSRADIPRRSNQMKTAEEIKIDKDETLLNIDYRKNRAEGPTGSVESPTFLEFPPRSTVFDEDSESPARIQAGHVEWQYRLNRNIKPLQKENPEVILEVYLLARDYQDMDDQDRPQYELLAKAALEFLRNDSKPADLGKIVSALQRYCAEEEQRTDTHLRACMAPMLCNRDVLKELWYRDDYIELMTGLDSASSMAALLQVALLDSL
ncbi:hypothetical protein MMC29_004066 [Sticta canariensis]|nr:hypothetical protein [Sticta canariensis]